MNEKRIETINYFKNIETKWQEIWNQKRIFEANPNEKKKYFITFPFPYMNGLPHLGSAFTILRVDIMARYKRMRGFNVLFPQGWHATGGPIVASARRIKEKDSKKIEELKSMGISDELIKNFEDPSFWVYYFTNEWEKDLKRYGLSIDWRRKFFTTSLNPYFSKFVEWQYYKLKELNFVAKGNHPVVWCPKEKKVVGDHDRPDEYAGIGPVDATIIKFATEEGIIIPTLTYRPETIFGVTNIWINPNYAYNLVEIDNEKWILNDYMAEELSDQKHEVKIIKKINGSELLGKLVINPINNEKIPILPAEFVIFDEGTGIVMSVPAHAPYDYIALEDIKKDKNIINKFGLNDNEIMKITPKVIIKTEGFKDIPSKELIKKLNIKSQKDVELLEKATKELYAKEFYNGIMDNNTNGYSNLKVSEAREKIINDLKIHNKALKIYTLPSKVYCRCGARTHVKFVENQWFLLYGNEKWKEKAREVVKNMNFYPESVRNDFMRLVDWLNDWAFTHMNELGTPLPWDNNWVIESLSDSTIYMAYYTIAHYIQGKIDSSKLKPELFDYIFLGKGDLEEISKITEIDKNLILKMREEFLYWYPVDLRISGKDLMQNHLLFFIYHHAAIFDKDKMPRGIGINGWVLLNGEKMSKSKGNFMLLREALDKWGADVTRWSEVMAGADPGYDDANFELSIAENAIDELIYWLDLVKNNYNKGRTIRLSIDDWFESIINSTIEEVTQDMEETKFKSALVKAYYYLKNKYKWYLNRVETPNKDLVNKYLENVTLMIAPIVPHVAEEAWHIMGHEDLISLHQWPIADKNKINKNYEKAEELIERIVKDSKELIGLLGDVNKIYIIIAAPWKYELFDYAKKILQNNKSIKEARSELIKSDLKVDKSLVAKVVDSILKYPELLESYVSRDLEVRSIKESTEFLIKELNKEIIIEYEENSTLPRSNLALPGKPALYLEK